MSTKVVSVVIRANNEDRHIGRLLDGISRQVLPVNWVLEVVLVDSGSTDSTVSIAEHMGARIVNIAKDRFSFGRALNIGCAEAKGEILVFASAHVYPVYTDWISRLVAAFDDPQVGLAYGRQIGDDVTRFSEHQVFAQWFPEQSNFFQSTPFCNNANCAIRRKLWEDQKYNEHLTGLEDLDWAKRIMAKHYKIVYDADASIVHIHEETFSKIRMRYQREAIAMKEILPNVHFGVWDFIRLFFISTLSDYLKAIRCGKFIRECFGIFAFRLMQYYGTYIGHNQHGEVTKELKNRFYYPGRHGIELSVDKQVGKPEKRNKIQYAKSYTTKDK